MPGRSESPKLAACEALRDTLCAAFPIVFHQLFTPDWKRSGVFRLVKLVYMGFLPYTCDMMKDKHTQDRSFVREFEHVSPYVSMENSYGTLHEDEDVIMVNTIGFDEDSKHGWFETYDKETGGDSYYAEGGLEIEEVNSKLTLTGYDGCFALPDYIVSAIEEKGVVIDL